MSAVPGFYYRWLAQKLHERHEDFREVQSLLKPVPSPEGNGTQDNA